jgi:hypothetical protein
MDRRYPPYVPFRTLSKTLELRRLTRDTEQTEQGGGSSNGKRRPSRTSLFVDY